MIRITVQVEGMMCGMCEAHVNDAIRRALPVKKVTSNHKKGQTVILTQEEIPDSSIQAAIRDMGYTPLGVTREEEQSRGLRGLFRK